MKILAATALLAAALTACGSDEAGDANVKPEAPASSVTSAPPEDTPTETEPPPPADHHLVKSDIALKTRIKSQQCFGSAGCNVEAAVSLSWAIPDPGKLDGTYEVTYNLTGDESGPYIDTLSIYPNGKYDVPYDASLSTPTANTPIRAIVTRVYKVSSN